MNTSRKQIRKALTAYETKVHATGRSTALEMSLYEALQGLAADRLTPDEPAPEAPYARERAERHVLDILEAHAPISVTMGYPWPAYCPCGIADRFRTPAEHRAHLATMLSPYPGAQISQ